MTFNNPDFLYDAEAYVAKGTKVRTVAELRSTLEKAFAGGGVHLVIVPIDYSENTRVLVDELRQRLPAT
jgi:acetolactate synthase-1/2/3 large subunit